MSMTQTTTKQDSSGLPRCPQCDAVLPPQAVFCGSCGERLNKSIDQSKQTHESDISTRYRIMSLVRRRSHVSLLFAFDIQQQRPVAIRDIDLSDLDDETQTTILETVKREYDLLRRQHMPYTMPVIDMRHASNHLYLVTGWPNSETQTQLHTLQDLLQSGAGLPNERVTLNWITRLCFALEYLHRHRIIIGDLDPQSIVLGDDNYQSQLALMASWLPASVRNLLPSATESAADPFIAPETMLEEKVEARSDLYSLGAIFYLLLTGQPPLDAKTRLQRQQRLRSPRELNPRVSSSIDAFVVRALALEPVERFQNASAMIATLTDIERKNAGYKMTQIKTAAPADTGGNAAEDEDWYLEETVTITPLKAHEAAASSTDVALSDTLILSPTSQPVPSTEAPESNSAGPSPVPAPTEDFDTELPDYSDEQGEDANRGNAAVQHGWRQRITGILPAIGAPQRQGNAQKAAPAAGDSWFKRLREFFLGEQQHTTASAATIETPMRVQPNQTYAIRIRLLGRDMPSIPATPGERKNTTPQGLSALIEGEIVYIEVRSVLYQSFAYIVQQAGVTIPAPGYAAEVTIPMQALASGPSGRRDRLHIFFLDGKRRPLYEKPFVVEIFVSHLVQSGREGHNVLTIPL